MSLYVFNYLIIRYLYNLNKLMIYIDLVAFSFGFLGLKIES